MKKVNRELFNDGKLTVCKADKRTIVSDLVELRYGVRTVGISRFWQARLADSSIDKLISVPFNNFINAKNIIIIDGVQYEVKQVQEKYDSEPPCQYISLQKCIPAYTDARNGG